MIIISPYAGKGVFHQQTTNVSILKFMQTLWGLPPLTPPPGDAVPSSFPATETLADGQVTFSVKFPAAGYWRIEAQGPNGSIGWVTVDVGVTPDTAP